MSNEFANPEEQPDNLTSSAVSGGQAELPDDVRQILEDPSLSLAYKFSVLMPPVQPDFVPYDRNRENTFQSFETENPLTKASLLIERLAHKGFKATGIMELLFASGLEIWHLWNKFQHLSLAQLGVEAPAKQSTIYTIFALGVFSLGAAYFLEPHENE